MVILPAVESVDCADPGVVACFQIPLSNRLYLIETRVVPHYVAHTTTTAAHCIAVVAQLIGGGLNAA
jgi:hypothetical protein